MNSSPICFVLIRNVNSFSGDLLSYIFLSLFLKGTLSGKTFVISRSGGLSSIVEKKSEPTLYYTYMIVYLELSIVLIYSLVVMN